MNERIQEFYSQVGLDFENFQRVTVKKGDMEKFAELIVRECIGIVKQRWINPDEDVIAEEIKQHFGVEE